MISFNGLQFLIKNLLGLINLVEVGLLMNQITNLQMNFINQLLENLKKEESIQYSKGNIIKGASIYCALLICFVNMHGSFLQNIKKGVLLLMHFKK